MDANSWPIIYTLLLCDSCGEVLGHLPEIGDASSDVKMVVMAKQIQDYELLVKQLKV